MQPKIYNTHIVKQLKIDNTNVNIFHQNYIIKQYVLMNKKCINNKRYNLPKKTLEDTRPTTADRQLKRYIYVWIKRIDNKCRC
jgi:hypothetical protein